MGDLGLRGKWNQLAFKAELLTQEPGAAALLSERTEHRASGDKLNNILEEEHTTTQQSLTTTKHTVIRVVRTGHTIQQRTKNTICFLYTMCRCSRGDMKSFFQSSAAVVHRGTLAGYHPQVTETGHRDFRDLQLAEELAAQI